jgi:arsenical pump membrane protein
MGYLGQVGDVLLGADAHVVVVGIVITSIFLMLVRPKGISEVWWIGAGVVLLLALRLVPLRLAGKAVAEGADVYLFLIGMMLLSELAKEHGVFDWVSSSAVRGAEGSCARLFALVYAVGAVVTICMSNDATAVVLTPAVLSAVRKAGVKPLPYLFACAMIANAASFALPISNPANLVVFRTGMPPLGQWLAAMALPSVLSIAVTYLVLRFYFRSDLSGSIEYEVEAKRLSPHGKLVLFGLAVVVAVLLAASAFKVDLGLPTCIAALVITAVVSVASKRNPMNLAREISWATLLLVAGLFIMVDAVETLGVLRSTREALQSAMHLPIAVAVFAISFVVGIANNVVNNLPLGLIAGATVQAAHANGLIAHAVLIGVDLGPNLSVTGSLATILWLLALRKEGLDVSAWNFLRVGALAMPLAMFAAIAGMLVTHWMFF